jgi:hypothetical protein
MRAWIQLFTLTRIRIQLPKKIETFNTGQGRIVDIEISLSISLGIHELQKDGALLLKNYEPGV